MVTNHDTVYNEFILFVGDGMADGADQSANGREFSTLDYDHDILSNEPCADLYQGAWWYRKCHNANLNGQYLNGTHESYADGINWYPFKGFYESLKTTDMKIRGQV